MKAAMTGSELSAVPLLVATLRQKGSQMQNWGPDTRKLGTNPQATRILLELPASTNLLMDADV